MKCQGSMMTNHLLTSRRVFWNWCSDTPYQKGRIQTPSKWRNYLHREGCLNFLSKFKLIKWHGRGWFKYKVPGWLFGYICIAMWVSVTSPPFQWIFAQVEFTVSPSPLLPNALPLTRLCSWKHVFDP